MDIDIVPSPIIEAELKRITEEYWRITGRVIEQSLRNRNMSETKIDAKDAHYQLNGNRQLIDVMQEVFSPNEVYTWCKLNVFKYTSRAGRKCLGSEDMRKAAWYAQKAQEIFDEMNKCGTGISPFPTDVKVSEGEPKDRTLKYCKE